MALPAGAGVHRLQSRSGGTVCSCSASTLPLKVQLVGMSVFRSYSPAQGARPIYKGPELSQTASTHSPTTLFLLMNRFIPAAFVSLLVFGSHNEFVHAGAFKSHGLTRTHSRSTVCHLFTTSMWD